MLAKFDEVRNGRRRIGGVYCDHTEIIEEFDVITDELLLRKSRGINALGAAGPWVIEVGGESSEFLPHRDILRESSDRPIFSCGDESDKIVFRIRNLPYPKEVYSVTVDTVSHPMGEIVVRTSNKKYFKRIEVADMRRAGIALDVNRLSFNHKSNTLIITYMKHLSMLATENAAKKDRISIQSVRVKETRDRQHQ